MTALSVNVNKIALLRNSRVGKGPDVVRLAEIALESGAAGITVHPRPDRRHVTPGDVDNLSAMLRGSRWASRELNVEGNPFEGDWLELCEKARPDQATLVPDAPGQATSDHGFAMPGDVDKLGPIVAMLKAWGCRVSVFMDPDAAAVARVPETGADRVELYTEAWAVAHERRDAAPAEYGRVRAAFADAARAAADAGLGVNAGHDLNLANLPDFVKTVGGDILAEVSIGHALVGDALELGLGEAVRCYSVALGGQSLTK